MSDLIKNSASQQSQKVTQTQQTNIKEFTKQVSTEIKVAMNELMDLSNELAGKVKDTTKKQVDKETVKDAQKLDKTTESLIAETAASALNQDEIKKKKKRKKLEEKLKNIADLLGNIDTEKLKKKEKDTIEQFKKNAKQLSELNNKLKLLDREEEHLEDILDKNKDKVQQLLKEDKQKKEQKEEEKEEPS